MKTSLVFLALSLIPTIAFADDFNCDSAPADHLHVLVQNNVHSADGTRKAAVLVVTDIDAEQGERTLVVSKNPVQNGAFWTATPSEPKNKEAIGGIEQNMLAKIQVYIPGFDYNEANKDGSQYASHLFLFEIDNTATFSQDIALTCVYNTKE